MHIWLTGAKGVSLRITTNGRCLAGNASGISRIFGGRNLKKLYNILELIVMVCMIILVHAKADVRIIIEAGVIYLAMVIRSTKEGEE